ncbi:uncharacterized protein LOC110860959 [Folsomia candida]|uniref:Serine/threonine-protein kinase TOR n=1 Tax=Folsomia candida TaxID=158441 RepID=A0A226D519_FOLCA|nr:uncharacterized protein LOC110860959 [Folsomia candida]OXA39837.1 Serine/threonine-protein kinase TOR [Folsomia candida]
MRNKLLLALIIITLCLKNCASAPLKEFGGEPENGMRRGNTQIMGDVPSNSAGRAGIRKSRQQWPFMIYGGCVPPGYAGNNNRYYRPGQETQAQCESVGGRWGGIFQGHSVCHYPIGF